MSHALILLDEPLSNLDAKLREEARYWIRKLIPETGTLCRRGDARPERGAGDGGSHPAAERRRHRAERRSAGDLRQSWATATPARILGNNNPHRRAASPADGAGARRHRRAGLVAHRMRRRKGPALATERTGHCDRARRAHADRRRAGPGTASHSDWMLSFYLGAYWEYRLNGSGLNVKAQGSRCRCRRARSGASSPQKMSGFSRRKSPPLPDPADPVTISAWRRAASARWRR